MIELPASAVTLECHILEDQVAYAFIVHIKSLTVARPRKSTTMDYDLPLSVLSFSNIVVKPVSVKIIVTLKDMQGGTMPLDRVIYDLTKPLAQSEELPYTYLSIYNAITDLMLAHKDKWPTLGSSNPADELAKRIPGINVKVQCPNRFGGIERCKSLKPIFDIIIHLNDIHEWSREDIADWLESLDADLRVL